MTAVSSAVLLELPRLGLNNVTTGNKSETIDLMHTSISYSDRSMMHPQFRL
jgi:hypothetical protein